MLSSSITQYPWNELQVDSIYVVKIVEANTLERDYYS